MGATTPDGAAPDGHPNRKMLIATGFGIVALFFVVDDLLRWIEGGGIFFIMACSLVVTTIGLQLNVDLRKRLPQFVFIFSIMGGGFILDGIYGPTTIQKFMTGHGYSRCPARDHVEGQGKGRVWFDDYVRFGAECPFQPTGPDGTAAKLPADPRSQLPRAAKPISSPALWFSSDDYPASALRQKLTGVVGIRYVVDPDGRVRRCVTVSSSGSQLLDATACGVLVTNARYWPARDLAGKPVAQVATQRVRWQLPSG